MTNNKFLLASTAAVLILGVSIHAKAQQTPYATEVTPDVKIAEPQPAPAPAPAPKVMPDPQNDLEAEGTVSPISESEIEAEVTQERLSVKDIDFNTIESAGLLIQSHGEGLGKQLYNNSKRSAISALIRAMPKSNWSVMQNLGNQVLLTSANTAALTNDIPADFENESDLLTLRIEKLMERGFYTEAYALYTRLNIDPFNEKIAKLGIISMLINGEKPLACVEIKTFDAPFKKDIFWKEMDAYCVLGLTTEKLPAKEAIIAESKNSILKSLVQDKSYIYTYAPDTFDKFSLFEKALLVGEGRINAAGLKPSDFAKIPPEHIQALLMLPDLANGTKILLNARGVETGVITPNSFAKTLIKIGRKAEKEKKTLTGLDHIATLYWKRLDTFKPEARNASIAEALEYARNYDFTLLVPFIEDFIADSPPNTLSLNDLHAIVRAFSLSNYEIPAPWLDAVIAAPATGPQQEKLKESLIIAATLLSAEKGNDQEKIKNIYKSLQNPKNIALSNLKNIIENVDSRTGSYAKVDFAYEKGFDLGENKSYTMPPAALFEQLELSKKSHATGETVLLCNLILQGIDQHSVYPGILADVAKSLSEVGLGKKARELLAEVILSFKY